MTVTIAAEIPPPYVHFDNRGLVLAAGGRCAAFYGAPMLLWLADTLDVVAAEGRATRHQFERVFGGFEEPQRKRVVLFGGERGVMVTVELGASEFERLRSELRAANPARAGRGG
jgi:hypothetical protein